MQGEARVGRAIWDRIGGIKINCEFSKSLRPELYRCNLTWKDNQTLLIGWTDWIKIGIIKMARANSSSSTAAKEVLPYYVEMRENPFFSPWKWIEISCGYLVSN